MADPAPAPAVPKTGHRERRRKARKSTEELCLVTVDMEPAGFGLMLDISEDGLGAQVMNHIEPGTKVRIAFSIPDTPTKIEGDGVIAWCDGDGRAGIRFQQIENGNANELRKWIDTLPDVTFREPAPIEPYRSHKSTPQEQVRAIQSQITASNLNTDLVLQFMVGHVVESVHGSGGAIALLDEGTMVCRASSGIAPEVGATIGSRSALTTECLQTGKVVRCDDTETDPRVDREICRGLNLRSSLILPILFEGSVRGVLEVFSPKPGAFDDDDLAFLQQLSEFTSQIVYGAVPAGSPETAPKNREETRPEHTAFSALMSEPDVPKVDDETASQRSADKPAEPKQSIVTAKTDSMPSEVTEPVILQSFIEEKSERSGAWLIVAVAMIVVVVAVGWWFISQRSNRSNRIEPVSNTPAPASVNVPPPTPAPAKEATAPVPQTRKPASLPIIATDTIHDSATNNTMPVRDPSQPLFIAPGAAPLARSPEPQSVEAPSITNTAIHASAEEVRLPGTEIAQPVLQSQGYVTGGKLIHKVAPVYPAIAKQQRIEGDVVFSATVTKRGTLANIRKVSGSPLLEAAGIVALRQWRYEPFRLNGTLQDVDVSITLQFRLPR
jgi:TonB family protein